MQVKIAGRGELRNRAGYLLKKSIYSLWAVL